MLCWMRISGNLTSRTCMKKHAIIVVYVMSDLVYSCLHACLFGVSNMFCMRELQTPQESYQTGLLPQDVSTVCVGLGRRNRHSVPWKSVQVSGYQNRLWLCAIF